MESKKIKNLNSVTIYCPSCKRRVASWDGRSENNLVVNCRKCWKRVVFHPDTKKTEIKDILPRNSGSGLTF